MPTWSATAPSANATTPRPPPTNARPRAQVALARANLQSAKLKLDYARVTSPIDGCAARAGDRGALVGEGQATPLTVVQQIDPIYVNFAQPAAEVLRLQKQIRDGQLQGIEPDKLRVRLLLPDGTEYARTGALNFAADLAVDPGTDNVTMRALFDNPRRDLLPGMYVRVRLEQAINRDAYLVPRDALLRDASGAHVLVAGKDGELQAVAVTRATYRPNCRHRWPEGRRARRGRERLAAGARPEDQTGGAGRA